MGRVKRQHWEGFDEDFLPGVFQCVRILSEFCHSVRSSFFLDEPTSMLQRMAEDMEFSGSLDAAANEQDPLKRIAYVAAFAMSNYSSTIGRIAKPFNPMLVQYSLPCSRIGPC